MADVIIKMEGTVTAGTTSGIAQVDAQDTGFIDAIFASMYAIGADALSDLARMEVGFASQQTFTTNDIRSSILTMSVAQNFLTSGGGGMYTNQFIVPPGGIPVAAGERIWMHGFADTGVTLVATAYLYITATRRGRVSRRNR